MRSENLNLMPHLHMRVWQPGTERKACIIKVFSCCQAHAIFCLWRG